MADTGNQTKTGVKINSIITPANMKITPNIAAAEPEVAKPSVPEPDPVLPSAAEQSLARAPERGASRGFSAGRLALVAIVLLGLIGVLMIPQLRGKPVETVAAVVPPNPTPILTPEAVQVRPVVTAPEPEPEIVAPKPVVVVATRPRPRPNREEPQVVAEAPVIVPETPAEPEVETVAAPEPQPDHEPEIVVAQPDPPAPAPEPDPVIVEEVVPVKHDAPAETAPTPAWQDGFVQQVTSGTLQALRGSSASTGTAERIDVAPAFAMLQAALDRGQSGAEIERTMNEAFQTSAIRLPKTMLQQNGQVDMAKLLEAFAAQ